ncbi:NAD-dependent epimerase/dehydratase family protein [Actibacterium pelagium]|uniref:Dihydroflavonol-4-reductase n=1 Tax=Actibacterium pelagium TaxID=2029103 RepID=A0A917AJC8_9RHOB|nr:NAD-dependent epimerase/dehydratase family protein [Actibacterium pelagium]GGE56292.1 dihydroflavonol-4-reductase [Actibacterium pelagium]
MFTIDTSKPVMVTGATGYVAGWIVKGLLEAGATVHAPVRNPDDAAKVKHLTEIAEASSGTLKLFAADLLAEGSYAEAMDGCATVFHTASPFNINVKDPQKDLIEPAVKGTENILEQANKTPSVERVVLTSSCAAIYGDTIDCANAPSGRLDESVWNTSSSINHNAYSYSKTLAEKAAWKIAEAQSQWKLVVINPSLVIGPALQDRPTSESFNILRQMGDGSMKTGAPKWGIGVVDVRDLAQAHLAAGFLPQANGRNIISAHETTLFDMSQELRDTFGADYPIPTRPIPKWLAWLIGPMVGDGVTRKAVERNVNVPFRADNSKALKELGLSYRPLRTSMEEMFQQMIDSGQLRKV